MFYEKELNFFINSLRAYHLRAVITTPNNALEENLDICLQEILGNTLDLKEFFKSSPKLMPFTLYRVTDSFLCRYILLLLPETKEPKLLIIGPYLSQEITKEKVLEQSEKIGLNLKLSKKLESFYDTLPHLYGNNPIFSLISTFAELIWNSPLNYLEQDIEIDYFSIFSLHKNQEDPSHPEDNSWNMQILEERYNFENQLLKAVSLGQTHKAEMIFSGFSESVIENRTADILRNLKNYCIILNTLLRKAAEMGDVHPIYLDSVSSDFAKEIEQITQIAKVEDFMKKMIQTYCRLVKNHSTKKFSTPVQKAIIKIDSDLTQDLTLKALSIYNNISPGYFSALFKSETGQTLTDFVNSRRVETAKRFLKNSNLQIQTISHHCGIYDVNYFTKLFKKYMGVTPKEYREKKRNTL